MSLLAICMFVLAWYTDRRFRTGFWGGMFPLLIAVGASSVLYYSELSRTMLGWADRGVVPLAENMSSVFGDHTAPGLIYSIVCVAGAVITGADLKVDKTYNPWACASLVITPVALHGSQDTWLTSLIDAVHMAIAWIVVPVVGGSLGA